MDNLSDEKFLQEKYDLICKILDVAGLPLNDNILDDVADRRDVERQEYVLCNGLSKKSPEELRRHLASVFHN